MAKSKKAEAKKGMKKPELKKILSSRQFIYAIIAVVIVVLAGWRLSTFSLSEITGAAVNDTQSAMGPDIGSDAVGAKVVDFLQSRLSTAYPGIEVELDNAELYENIPDTYEVNIKITFQGQTQTVPYYATKDGGYIFNNVADLNEELPTQNTQPQDSGDQGDICSQLGITKSDKPVVEVFIMSYCPYGLQMQKAVLPVMKLLGNKADIEIKWVYYVMHSQKEIDENNVQECIKSEYPDKYVDYATCFTVSGDSDSCLEQSGIDSATIDSCIADLDAEFSISELYANQSTWLSGRYPLYNVHIVENQKYGVGGSPATVINGKVVSVSRSPEAVKQAVCCAFNSPPAECQQTLSSAASSPGIGGETGTDTGAQC